MKKNKAILTVGTVAIDDITSPYGSHTGLLGGSAVHFAMAARFLADVQIVAPIGKDFPQEFLEFLRARKIDVSSICRLNGSSFRWKGSYGHDFCDATTISTNLGVLERFSPVLTPFQQNMKYVFLANIDPKIQLRLLRSLKKPKILAVDTMNYWITNSRGNLIKVLENIDIFFVNEQEIKQLSGENILLKAIKTIKKLGIGLIVVKKGENGVLLYSDNFMIFAPAYPLEKIVDPTGAGDSFAGAFLSYLVKHRSFNKQTLKEALLYSCVIASFTVEDFGVLSLAHIGEHAIKARLNHFKKMLLTL